jgi:hypothetical protein
MNNRGASSSEGGLKEGRGGGSKRGKDKTGGDLLEV